MLTLEKQLSNHFNPAHQNLRLPIFCPLNYSAHTEN